LVFTGREILQTSSSPNPVQVFVTVVARTDIDGNPRKLFSSVTTSDRLDVTPRLDLVDAVDADGDKRAELLFRRVRDNDAEFIIYRVGVDGLTELFHGGNAE
jgi:Ni2+-binding GTPase involved in maturation of urease and hydrogenase